MARPGRGGPLLGDALAVWDSIRTAMPYLEDEALVTVHGNPKATRRELYFLAAACGFSLVRRYDVAPAVGPPPSVIMLEWDASSNVVRFTLKYKTNLITASIADTENTLSKLALFGSPPEEVKGAAWGYTGAFALGLGIPGPAELALRLVPGARELAGVKPRIPTPVLPFEGRPILTRLPTCEEPNPIAPKGTIVHSPNPRPSGDDRSRGTFYQLLYSALTTPQGAGLKQFGSPTPDTKFKGG